MDALVELIKKIGIFMIAAQAVIHFAPEMKYAKYMKLIVSIMILLQFLSPVYRIVGGMEADWGARLSDMEQEIQNDMRISGLPEAYADSHPVADTVVKSMEQEIKSKLNTILLSDNSNKSYIVTSVTVNLEAALENGGNAPEYVLNRILVVVWEHAEGTDGAEHAQVTEGTDDVNGIGRIEKVQIEKIDITADGIDKEDDMPSAYGGEKAADSLRKRFCNGLGVDEKYMEVRVYGAFEEAAE